MLEHMGAILCLVSAACFGAMAVFGKLAYAAGVTPQTLLLIRFGLAAVTLGLVLAVARRPVTAPRRTLAAAFGMGAIGYAAQASLFFAALERMDASLLSLILYTYPLFVTVGAVLLGRDRLTRARAAALLAASAGTLLVLLGAGTGHLDRGGVVLGFGAALTYTVYILVADHILRDLPPLLLTGLVMAGAATTFTVQALVTGGVRTDFAAAGWRWLIAIALISTVLAILTFFAGLRRTGPSTAAILSTFEPVVTTILAAATLGENPTAPQIAGGLLIILAAALLHLRTKPSKVALGNRTRNAETRS